MQPKHFIPSSQELVPVLSQMNLVHTLQSYFFKILFNIILPSLPMGVCGGAVGWGTALQAEGRRFNSQWGH
jgi:hypothetical protein